MDLRDLDRFGRSHHGLVTFDHASEHGIDRTTWNRLVAGTEPGLERISPTVARAYGAPITREQRILAAVLSAGDDAVASHRSAAWLWGVDRPSDDPIDVIVPARTRRSRLTGVAVHRPRDLEEIRPVMRLGIPTTNPLRMLLDLGAVDPGGVRAALTHVVMAGFATPNAIGAALDRHAQRGRNGIRALRRALGAWIIDGKPSDSELENRMAAVFERYRLPPFQFHAVLAGHEVDFRIIDAPIVIECDGWSTHGADRDTFHHDRRRDADLHALGLVVVRVTASMLFGQPRQTALRIARAVWVWAPDVASRCLAHSPSSILGAVRPQ